MVTLKRCRWSAGYSRPDARLGGILPGQRRLGGRPVNRRHGLRWFESITRHSSAKRPLISSDAGQGPILSRPAVDGPTTACRDRPRGVHGAALAAEQALDDRARVDATPEQCPMTQRYRAEPAAVHAQVST